MRKYLRTSPFHIFSLEEVGAIVLGFKWCYTKEKNMSQGYHNTFLADVEDMVVQSTCEITLKWRPEEEILDGIFEGHTSHILCVLHLNWLGWLNGDRNKIGLDKKWTRGRYVNKKSNMWNWVEMMTKGRNTFMDRLRFILNRFVPFSTWIDLTYYFVVETIFFWPETDPYMRSYNRIRVCADGCCLWCCC